MLLLLRTLKYFFIILTLCRNLCRGLETFPYNLSAPPPRCPSVSLPVCLSLYSSVCLLVGLSVCLHLTEITEM